MTGVAPIELQGSRVLVVGGSGVLGGLLAAELAERGAAVTLAGRDAERLQRNASAIGPETPSVIADLRLAGHAEHAVSTAVEFMTGLDGVVNAAGVVAFGGLDELDDATLDEVIATDLVGPIRVMRAALQHLDGGFFVNVTGVVADTPMPGMAVYSAAKAGLSAATAALGKELRRRSIHVLDARPPHTETGLASRPIAGSAPSFPTGLEPTVVARLIVDGLAAGARVLTAEAFQA